MTSQCQIDTCQVSVFEYKSGGRNYKQDKSQVFFNSCQTKEKNKGQRVFRQWNEKNNEKEINTRNAASEDHGDNICNDKTSDKDEVM
mgnify:CR=1 FL=1